MQETFMHKKLFAIVVITLALTGNFYASPEQEAREKRLEYLEKQHHKLMRSLTGASICLASCAAIGAAIAVTKKGDWLTGAIVGTILGCYPAVKTARSLYSATGVLAEIW
jgi:hypothetical protein